MNNNEIKLLLDKLYSVDIKDFNDVITIGNELKMFGNGEFMIMYRKDNQNFNLMNLDIDISDKNTVNIKGKGENKMKNIKEMLKSGDKTPDELREILEKEITEALEEMKKQEFESIETRRNDLALSLIRYGEALGLDFDIKVEDAAAILKEMEPEIKKYAKILKILLEDIEVDEDEKKEAESRIFKPSLTKYNKDVDKKMDELVAKVMKGLL